MRFILITENYTQNELPVKVQPAIYWTYLKQSKVQCWKKAQIFINNQSGSSMHFILAPVDEIWPEL